jgi:hypothetical protein
MCPSRFGYSGNHALANINNWLWIALVLMPGEMLCAVERIENHEAKLSRRKIAIALKIPLCGSKREMA